HLGRQIDEAVAIAATVAPPALEARCAVARPSDRSRAPIAPAALAAQAHLEPFDGAWRRIEGLGEGDAGVAQDHPTAARRVAPEADLVVAQVRVAPIRAAAAGGAEADGARLDPSLVAARAAAAPQRHSIGG